MGDETDAGSAANPSDNSEIIQASKSGQGMRARATRVARLSIAVYTALSVISLTMCILFIALDSIKLCNMNPDALSVCKMVVNQNTLQRGEVLVSGLLGQHAADL